MIENDITQIRPDDLTAPSIDRRRPAQVEYDDPHLISFFAIFP
jgi:hypothetical protein